MASTPNNFAAALEHAWPLAAWRDVNVLLAVSGGADSVALLRAICAIAANETSAGQTSTDGGPGSVPKQPRIFVAHLNHGLRGEESDADEAFVVELCQQLNVACEVGRSNVAQQAAEQGDGIEAAARAARYVFFEETAKRVGARYVVTAHTADDQAETILHRIVRGTGVAGLAGIAKHRELCDGVALARPLLKLRRADVLSYLTELDQPFREDTSNLDNRFARNRIRHELLPQLEADYNPSAVEAILRLGRLAGEAQQVIDVEVDRLSESLVLEQTPTTVRLRLAALSTAKGGVSDFLVRELLLSLWRKQQWPLQQMTLAHWEQLAEMIRGKAAPAAVSLPGGIAAKKEVGAKNEGEQLLLTRPR